MMIQLLIQFQKYILSTIYIYIFLSMNFSIESDSKVSMNFSRRYDSSHVSVTWFSYTHTHTRARHPIRKRIVSIFHPCFLRRRSWRIWRIQPSAENGENERRGKEEERERERETMEFFFFLVPGELRARDWNIAQVVLCYGNGELTVTWIEENSIALTDEPEGRCFSWGKMEKSMTGGKTRVQLLI